MIDVNLPMEIFYNADPIPVDYVGTTPKGKIVVSRLRGDAEEILTFNPDGYPTIYAYDINYMLRNTPQERWGGVYVDHLKTETLGSYIFNSEEECVSFYQRYSQFKYAVKLVRE